jgi:predicted nucleic acid-binding protein
LRVYYDPSCLIALYIAEPLSGAIRAFVERQDQPVLINDLLELEFKNGVRQKVLRQEINEQQLARSLRLFDDDAVSGKIKRKVLAWPAVYKQAETISRRWSAHRVCRSFDLLHVAIAAISDVRQFATADQGQAQLARKIGLKVVNFS